MNKDLLDDKYGRFREIPLALSEKGHTVKGLCLSYSKKTPGKYTDRSVEWTSINATPFIIPGLLNFIIQAFILSKKVDIIWACSDSLYGIIGYFVAHKSKIPLIFDLYDNFEANIIAKLPIIRQLYRLVLKRCSHVTCASTPLIGLVKSYGRKKPITMIPNGISKNMFYPMSKSECRRKLQLPSDKILIGTAGSLYKNRGINELFQVYKILKKKYHNLFLAVAGHRDVVIPSDKGIIDLGLLPFEQIPCFFNSLDVAVVCNAVNKFGLYCYPQKAVEIMACKTPMIASNVGGMRDLFKKKQEWLYQPNNLNSFKTVLENRLADQSTEYEAPDTWYELSTRIETTISGLVDKDKVYFHELL